MQERQADEEGNHDTEQMRRHLLPQRTANTYQQSGRRSLQNHVVEDDLDGPRLKHGETGLDGKSQ